jgi:GntR family transcriptional regulator, arabinose operon transcriptional repressor
MASDNPERTELPEAVASAPKYLELSRLLESDIKRGRWAPGGLLPTEHQLTKELAVSRNTVRQALTQLENRKMITRVRGKGTFVAEAQSQPGEGGQTSLASAFAFISPQLRTTVVSSLLVGFQEACAGHYYDMLLGKTDNDIGRQADVIIQMLERKVGGIAILPTVVPTPPHQLRHIQSHRVPLVLCHRTVEGVSAPSVVFRGDDVGRTLAAELVRLGHRRIGFLFFYRYSLIEGYRKGIQDVLSQSGADPEGIVSVEYGTFDPAPPNNLDDMSDRDEQAIQQGLSQLLALPDPPTVIFCSQAQTAEVAYLQLTAMGFEIPRDISLVCVSSTWRTGGLAARLSGVGIAEHEIGAKAVEMLDEMRRGIRPLDDAEQIVMTPHFLEGATLGPAKASRVSM